HVGDRRTRPILVVEDDPASRAVLRQVLEKQGHRVVEAGNGREALAHLGGDGPGLILLDLMMPEMDGFQFLEELRQRGDDRRFPVVVVTAMDLATEEMQL